MTALVAVLVTLGLVVATRYGRAGVVIGIGATQALLVPAWVLGTALPGRVGGSLIGLAAAVAADAALVVRDRTTLAVLLGVLALAFPAMLLHQLSRGVVRVRVTESMSGVALLVAAVVGLSSCVALARAVDGPRLVAAVVAAAGAGLVVARLLDAALPAPRLAHDVPYGLLAVLAGTAAGAAAGAAVAAGARQLSAVRRRAARRGGRGPRHPARDRRRLRRRHRRAAPRRRPAASRSPTWASACRSPSPPPSATWWRCLWQGDPGPGPDGEDTVSERTPCAAC